MVRAKNHSPVRPAKPAPVPAVPVAVEPGGGGDLGQSPHSLMALVWGIPVGILILSVVVRSCVGG